MQRTLRTLLLVVALVVTHFALSSNGFAADFSAVWDGATGNWGDSLHWSTNPTYPNNTGGVTYDATISSGHVTLDRDITLQRFFLNGNFTTFGMLDGAFALNLNEGFDWAAGGIGNSTINLATGSTSSISTSSPGAGFAFRCGGTLNNSGTVNQTGYFNLYALELGDSAIINNLAGATWNLQGAGGINLPTPFGYMGSGGTFNNAGNLIVTPTSSSTGLQTAVNNSGNITIQTPGGGGSDYFFIHHGTANGSFNVAAQTTLRFYSYIRSRLGRRSMGRVSQSS